MKKYLNKNDILGSLRELNNYINSIEKPEDNGNSTNWRPIPCEDYKVPELVIPESTAKGGAAKLRTQLSKTLAFIDLNKQRRFKDCCTIMPIPTTNRKLLSIYGSSMSISRAIEFMVSLGLISIENNEYSFNKKNSSGNFSKTYRYYYENEILIKKYCSENNINKYIVSNVSSNSYNNALVNTCKIDSFEPDSVRFSSHLHLLKPDDFSVAMFEEYLTNLLYQNYPKLREYQILADDINSDYYEDYPDFQIRFVPSFTWNKGNKSVSGISIRATNSLCGATKDIKEDKISRQEILDKYNFNLHKDVKSSVPRITVSLNQGYWIPEDVDIYEDIFSRLTMFSNLCYDFDSFREILKKFHMSAYFDSYSSIGKNVNWRTNAAFEYEDIKDIMLALKDAVEHVEGHLYDTEIFYHESCLYLKVLKWLLDNNFFTWEVYDSWYSNGTITQKEFEDLVTNVIEDIANNYIEEWFDQCLMKH